MHIITTFIITLSSSLTYLISLDMSSYCALTKLNIMNVSTTAGLSRQPHKTSQQLLSSGMHMAVQCIVLKAVLSKYRKRSNSALCETKTLSQSQQNLA